MSVFESAFVLNPQNRLSPRFYARSRERAAAAIMSPSSSNKYSGKQIFHARLTFARVTHIFPSTKNVSRAREKSILSFELSAYSIYLVLLVKIFLSPPSETQTRTLRPFRSFVRSYGAHWYATTRSRRAANERSYLSSREGWKATYIFRARWRVGTMDLFGFVG